MVECVSVGVMKKSLELTAEKLLDPSYKPEVAQGWYLSLDAA